MNARGSRRPTGSASSSASIRPIPRARVMDRDWAWPSPNGLPSSMGERSRRATASGAPCSRSSSPLLNEILSDTHSAFTPTGQDGVMSTTFDPESVDKAPEPAGPAPEYVGPAPEFVGPSSSPPSFPSPSHPGRRLAAIGLVGGLVLGSLGGGAVGASLVAHNQRATASPPATTTTLVAAPSTVPGSVAAIYKQAIPGVVTISATVGTPRSFSQATGTGFVVDTSAAILPTAPVVDAPRSLSLTITDDRTVHGR